MLLSKISFKDIGTYPIHRLRQYQFPIPTEVIIGVPNVNLTPIMGRYYKLDLWAVGTEYLSYPELSKLPEFSGTSNYQQLCLVELWVDNGPDGHIEFNFTGDYGIITETTLHTLETTGIEYYTGIHSLYELIAHKNMFGKPVMFPLDVFDKLKKW